MFGYEPKGRGFESLQPYQKTQITVRWSVFFAFIGGRDSNPERVSGENKICRWHVLRREVRSGYATRTASAKADASLQPYQKTQITVR